jgi:hypothetical protein
LYPCSFKDNICKKSFQVESEILSLPIKYIKRSFEFFFVHWDDLLADGILSFAQNTKSLHRPFPKRSLEASQDLCNALCPVE